MAFFSTDSTALPPWQYEPTSEEEEEGHFVSQDWDAPTNEGLMMLYSPEATDDYPLARDQPQMEQPIGNEGPSSAADLKSQLHSPSMLDLFIDTRGLVMRLHQERQITRRLSNLQWHVLFLIIIWVVTLIQTNIRHEFYMSNWLMATFVNPGNSPDPQVPNAYSVRTTSDIISYLQNIWIPNLWKGQSLDLLVPSQRMMAGWNYITSSVTIKRGRIEAPACLKMLSADQQMCGQIPRWTSTETIWLEGSNILAQHYGAMNTLRYIDKDQMWCKEDLQMPFAQTCPAGWSYFVDRCYRLFPIKSWNAAADFCRTIPGGSLVSVHSAAQQKFLGSLFQHEDDWHASVVVDSYNDAWIGLTVDRGSWVWSDGSTVVYSNWAPGRSVGSLCGTITKGASGLWAAEDCDLELPFICEMPAANSSILIEDHCGAVDYGGSVNLTAAGSGCVPWTSLTSPSTPLSWVGRHNYCRNPTDFPANPGAGPWCYTADDPNAYSLCEVRDPIDCKVDCQVVQNASELASQAAASLQTLNDGETGFVSMQINLRNINYNLLAVLRLVYVVLPTGLVSAVARSDDLYGDLHHGSLLQVVRQHFYWYWVDWLRLFFEIFFLAFVCVFSFRLLNRFRHLALQTGWRMAAFTFNNIYDFVLFSLLITAIGLWIYVIIDIPKEASLGEGNGGYTALRIIQATIMVMMCLRTLRYLPLYDKVPVRGTRFLNVKMMYYAALPICGIIIVLIFSALFLFWVYGPVRKEFSTYGKSFATILLAVMARRQPLGIVSHSNGLGLSTVADLYVAKRSTFLDSGTQDWWWTELLNGAYGAWAVFTVQFVWWLTVLLILVGFSKGLAADVARFYSRHAQELQHCQAPMGPKTHPLDLYLQVLKLGGHPQFNVLRMLEARGWIEPLMNEHESQMLQEANVTAVGGALDVVIVLKKPSILANSSVFSNAQLLFIVLPDTYVRRTRGGWTYWLQQIGISEHELLNFSTVDLAQLLSEATHCKVDRHHAAVLRASYLASEADVGTFIATQCCIMQGDTDPIYMTADLFGNVLRVPLSSISIRAGKPIHISIQDVLANKQPHAIHIPVKCVKRTRYGNLALISKASYQSIQQCPYVILRSDDPITPEDIVLMMPSSKCYWKLHERMNGNDYARNDVSAAELSRYRLYGTRIAELEAFCKQDALWYEGVQWLLDMLGWRSAVPEVKNKWRHLVHNIHSKLAYEATAETDDFPLVPMMGQQVGDPKYGLFYEDGYGQFQVSGAGNPMGPPWQYGSAILIPSTPVVMHNEEGWDEEGALPEDEHIEDEDNKLPEFPMNKRVTQRPELVLSNAPAAVSSQLVPYSGLGGGPLVSAQTFQPPLELYGPSLEVPISSAVSAASPMAFRTQAKPSSQMVVDMPTAPMASNIAATPFLPYDLSSPNASLGPRPSVTPPPRSLVSPSGPNPAMQMPNASVASYGVLVPVVPSDAQSSQRPQNDFPNEVLLDANGRPVTSSSKESNHF